MGLEQLFKLCGFNIFLEVKNIKAQMKKDGLLIEIIDPNLQNNIFQKFMRHTNFKTM